MRQKEEDQTIRAATLALRTLVSRLDTLNSINAENILIPDGAQARYHELIEEAYAALSRLETMVDELRVELEYQHKRLDEARDEALEHEGKP